MRNFPVFLGLGSIVVIGLALFSLGARNLWRAFASYRWPTALATVVESSTEVTAGNRSSVASRDQSRSTMYMARIKFQYDQNGRSYSTDQIYIGQTAGSGDPSEAELRRFRYPLGAKVPVSYDPSDPSIASVHPGLQAEVLWLPGAGLAFLVPALMIFELFRGSEGSSAMGAGLTIFCVIFMSIGSILLFFGGRALWHGWKSSDWPAARGVIVYGHRDESLKTTHVEGDERTYTDTVSGARTIYRFEVDGRTHYSNTRAFGQLAGSDAEWADRIAERYPVGREVTVRYRRDNPDLAVLEPGVSKESLWAPGAGAAFLLFGLAVLIFGVPAISQSG